MTELTQYVYAFDKANEPLHAPKTGMNLVPHTGLLFRPGLHGRRHLSVNRSTFRVPTATGPLYVEGAMPGDVLVVDVLSVEVADKAPSPPSRTSVRCMTGA